MNYKLLRFFCLICAVCLFIGSIPFQAASPKNSYSGNAVNGSATISDDSLTLTVEQNGRMTVADAQNGYTWISNFADASEDPISFGVNQQRILSQLLVSYLGSTIVMETASFEQGVQEGVNFTELFADEHSVTCVYHFEQLGFVIPVEYRLDGRKLKVQIEKDKVLETKKNRLIDFSLLPFFGAGTMEENGFLLIPDGSGAVIRFNNGKTGENRLELEALYGDRSKVPETRTAQNQPVLMPAFGICHERDGGNATVFAYATEGEWGGKLSANISGRETAMNYAYYTFLFREYNTETMLDRTYAAKSKLVVDSEPVSVDCFEMTYLFGDPMQSGLAAMAASAKELLFPDRQETKRSIPVFLDIMMGVRVKRNFLGIPYKTLEKLTSLSEVEQIIAHFRTQGATDFEIRLQGLSADGFASGKIDSKLEVHRKIGSAKQISEMISDQVKLYPAVDLTDYNASGNGASAFFHSSYDLLLDTIQWPQFFLASGGENENVKADRLLNPNRVEKASQKLIANLKNQKISCVSPSSLAQGVYPDHSRNNKVRLMQTGDKFMRILAEMGKDQQLLLETPVCEAWQSTDAILYLPSTSSGYNICDDDVPFLQMILSGVVPYSTDSLNDSGNQIAASLRCIRNGAAPTYRLMNAPYKTVMNTDARDLYAASFADVKDLATASYRTVSEALKPVYGLAMIDYATTPDGLQICTYSNGAKMLINPTTEEIVYEGTAVGSQSFTTLRTEAVS